MKISTIRSHFSTLGLFFFLALVSVGYATTTESSRFFIEISRLLFIVGALLVISSSWVFGRINRTQLIASILLLSVLLYAVVASYLSGSFWAGSMYLWRDSLVLLPGVYILGLKRKAHNHYTVAALYVIYVVAALFMTISVGGLDLTIPPHFDFDYRNDMLGTSALYSQGISKFFGFGALAGIYLCAGTGGKYFKWLYALFSLTCLILSILGGARGDALAAILVVAGFVTYKYQKRFLLIFLMLSGLIFVLIEYWDYLANEFVFFERFSWVGRGDYGVRDVLFSQALALLSDEPGCLLAGCGLGYFQYHYNFDFGLYPHNVLLESVITFGLPAVIIFCILTFRGLKIYTKNVGGIDLLVLFFAMGMIIDLKSGYVFGNWLTMSMMMYFMGICLASLTKSPISKNADSQIFNPNAGRSW